MLSIYFICPIHLQELLAVMRKKEDGKKKKLASDISLKKHNVCKAHHVFGAC